jgi:hypothetical protein
MRWYSRERPRRSTTSKDRKCQNEHHDLCTTIQSRRSDVIVLDEQLWSLAAQVILSEETDGEEHEDAGVDADEEISHLPEDNGGIDVGEDPVLVEFVGNPEWDGDEEADYVGDCDLETVSKWTSC